MISCTDRANSRRPRMARSFMEIGSSLMTCKMADLDNSILDELRAQTAWLKLLAEPVLRTRLERVLDSERKRKVYELTTGDATVREISRESGAGLGTVSGYWNEWSRLDVVRTIGNQGRVARIASLASLGIPLDPRGQAPRSTEEA